MEQMTPVLVVTPHPDDAEGGAGGTIARWTKQGRKVVLVVCTNGDKGTSDRNVKPEDLARLRAEEPDPFLDTTAAFTTKLDALYCHASQMKRPRAEREANTRAHYAEIGKKTGVELAEAFKRIEIFR